MLSITVEFLHGTYRADPVGLAHTGRLETAEWPPSPLRLFAALVAADGTRDRCRYTDGSELEFLEACSPPRVFATAERDVHHQPLLPRFVVEQSGRSVKGSIHQEYLARTGAEVRPGVRAAPKDSLFGSNGRLTRRQRSWRHCAPAPLELATSAVRTRQFAYGSAAVTKPMRKVPLRTSPTRPAQLQSGCLNPVFLPRWMPTLTAGRGTAAHRLRATSRQDFAGLPGIARPARQDPRRSPRQPPSGSVWPGRSPDDMFWL